jgi:hypothetical protein
MNRDTSREGEPYVHGTGNVHDLVIVVAYLGALFFLYLILSFPAGRLPGRLDRALMAVTIVLVTAGQWAWLLFADSRRLICRTCPANLLEVAHQDTVAKLLYSLRGLCVLAVAVTGIGLLAVRWRRASRPQRQAVMPVAVAGAAAIVAITASHVPGVLGAGSRDLAFAVEDDGTGFVPASTPKGTGLQGISDRLAALNGTVDITSAPGHGTRVTGRVPAPPIDMSRPAAIELPDLGG